MITGAQAHRAPGGRVRVGTSGYLYRHWRGVLYPEGLGQRTWLPWYARWFDTVEMNATFYRLPSAAAVDRWREIVPREFTFAVKGSRYLTHLKRLLEVDEGVARFYEAVEHFGPKLGPVLWQLPPRMKPDLARLDRFLSRVPAGRHAVEFRDLGWYTEETCAVLDAHGAAFCEHDQLPLPPPRRTGHWRYLRFHGATARYDGGYGPDALGRVAEDLQASARRGEDAFVYFNNDLGGHAVRDALTLLALLGEDRPGLEASAAR
ncbi:MAG TPA: DUF72 domain-containing protein [Anaeromyxobacter sp.]|nr:DUF72 domain-containing protein [Anaeromyxobacter sp.]